MNNFVRVKIKGGIPEIAEVVGHIKVLIEDYDTSDTSDSELDKGEDGLCFLHEWIPDNPVKVKNLLPSTRHISQYPHGSEVSYSFKASHFNQKIGKTFTAGSSLMSNIKGQLKRYGRDASCKKIEGYDRTGSEAMVTLIVTVKDKS